MSQAQTSTATLEEPHGHAHHPNLAHHFESMQQQNDAGKLAMWVFLATEILMFGGLFCAYAVWRARHYDIFDIGHVYLDTKWGAINTVILIASSFTMAWGVRCAQLNKRTACWVLCLLTVLGGFGFMGIKYVEYTTKFSHGMGPGRYYTAPVHAEHDLIDPGHASLPTRAERVPSVAAVTLGEALADEADPTAVYQPAIYKDGSYWNKYGHTPQQLAAARPFFSIYFALTGLHGLHVLVGMALVGWITVRAYNGAFSAEYNAPVDIVGLYWHLVDLIWIFLFPLLYLI
jgi:cytochrome c oxidase subunit III